MRYKIETYVEEVDGKHKQIHKREYLDGTAAEFYGVGHLMIETPMGSFPREFAVKIEVENIDDAFEKFDEEIKKELPNIKAEIEKELKEEVRQQSSGIIIPE